jgi:hypothetical protein
VCDILGAVSIVNGSCVLGAVTCLAASSVGGLLLGIAVCGVVVPAVGKDVDGGRARRRMAAHDVRRVQQSLAAAVEATLGRPGMCRSRAPRGCTQRQQRRSSLEGVRRQDNIFGQGGRVSPEESLLV